MYVIRSSVNWLIKNEIWSPNLITYWSNTWYRSKMSPFTVKIMFLAVACWCWARQTLKGQCGFTALPYWKLETRWEDLHHGNRYKPHMGSWFSRSDEYWTLTSLMVGLSSRLCPCKHVGTWGCLTVQIWAETSFLSGRVVYKELGGPWDGGVSRNWSWMTKSAYWRKITTLRVGHFFLF